MAVFLIFLFNIVSFLFPGSLLCSLLSIFCCLWFYNSDKWKISIFLCIVKSVSNNELIWNIKSKIINLNFYLSAVWFI